MSEYEDYDEPCDNYCSEEENRITNEVNDEMEIDQEIEKQMEKDAEKNKKTTNKKRDFSAYVSRKRLPAREPVQYCVNPNGYKVVREHSTRTFTTNTDDSVCWWCTFPREPNTQPVCLPRYINYKSQIGMHKDNIEGYGSFCSLNCAKAYLLSEKVVNINVKLDLFNFVCRNQYRHLYVTKDGPLLLHAAPPKSYLAKFGGPMTIEEFRATSYDTMIKTNVPPNVVLIKKYENPTHNIKETLAANYTSTQQNIAASATKRAKANMKYLNDREIVIRPHTFKNQKEKAEGKKAETRGASKIKSVSRSKTNLSSYA